MAGTNEFFPFATDPSASLLSKAMWEGNTLRPVGNVPGSVANSALVNKALRQATSMSAALGKLISNNNFNALDDGNIDTLAESLINGISKAVSVPDATTTKKGVVQLATVDEANAGVISDKVITPSTAKAAVLTLMAAFGGSTIPQANETNRGTVKLATIGEASAGVDDTSAMTPAKTKAAFNAFVGGGGIPDAIPKGFIGMWSGAINTIPTGWALCDGNNGTPNLLDRFIKSVPNASTNPGQTGGSHFLSLSTTHIPSHSHTIKSHSHNMYHNHSMNTVTTTNGSHRHQNIITNTSHNGIPYYSQWTYIVFNSQNSPSWTENNGNDYYTYAVDKTSLLDGHGRGGTYSYNRQTAMMIGRWSEYAGDHSHSISGNTGSPSSSSTQESGQLTTNSVGDGTSFDNRPKFYELAFIMKL